MQAMMMLYKQLCFQMTFVLKFLFEGDYVLLFLRAVVDNSTSIYYSNILTKVDNIPEEAISHMYNTVHL